MEKSFNMAGRGINCEKKVKLLGLYALKFLTLIKQILN